MDLGKPLEKLKQEWARTAVLEDDLRDLEKLLERQTRGTRELSNATQK